MATTQEYALLALRVYNTEPDVRGPLPSGWSVIQELADDAVGFSAGAYLKGGEIVIAFTGTNDQSLDWEYGNLPAGLGVVSKQVGE